MWQLVFSRFQHSFFSLDWDVTNPIPWKPIVDSFASVPFMPMSFEESIKAGNFPTDVPIVAGFTAEEGLVSCF